MFKEVVWVISCDGRLENLYSSYEKALDAVLNQPYAEKVEDIGEIKGHIFHVYIKNSSPEDYTSDYRFTIDARRVL